MHGLSRDDSLSIHLVVFHISLVEHFFSREVEVSTSIFPLRPFPEAHIVRHSIWSSIRRSGGDICPRNTEKVFHKRRYSYTHAKWRFCISLWFRKTIGSTSFSWYCWCITDYGRSTIRSNSPICRGGTIISQSISCCVLLYRLLFIGDSW